MHRCLVTIVLITIHSIDHLCQTSFFWIIFLWRCAEKQSWGWVQTQCSFIKQT